MKNDKKKSNYAHTHTHTFCRRTLIESISCESFRFVHLEIIPELRPPAEPVHFKVPKNPDNGAVMIEKLAKLAHKLRVIINFSRAIIFQQWYRCLVFVCQFLMQ